MSSSSQEDSGSGLPIQDETIVFECRVCEFANHFLSLPILERLLGDGRIDLPTQQRLRLAFEEAFANSMEHGSLELDSEWKEQYDESGVDRYTKERKSRLEDPQFSNRLVKVETGYDGHKLVIKISDEGRGFMLSKMRETLLDSPVTTFHGRGLRIIASIMDEVDFDSSGTTITMVKYFV